MAASGKFNEKERSQFESGGSLSTEHMREEVPADHFLMPAERKYPYKNKDSSISCNMLRAAMSRAGQNKEMEIEAKAKRMFKMHCAA